jgi:hypothetical protein
MKIKVAVFWVVTLYLTLRYEMTDASGTDIDHEKSQKP